ncbi:unnamed protein product [Choristocarpus tenellus]
MSVTACDDMPSLNAALAAAGDKLVVIDFHATWCGPCRRIAPFIQTLANSTPEVVFLKVDVDNNSEAAQKYEIEAMPTFLFIKGGEVLEKVMGASEEKIGAAIQARK